MQKLPERLEFSLSFHASRLAMALRREQMIALKPFQLTPEQWQVLAVLWEFDTVSQSDLAAITQRDEPSISRMVRTMETNGWVERNIDKTDGRTRRIRPSNKAWESRAELFNALDSRLRAIHGQIQPTVLDGLMDQVKACANELERIASEGGEELSTPLPGKIEVDAAPYSAGFAEKEIRSSLPVCDKDDTEAA